MWHSWRLVNGNDRQSDMIPCQMAEEDWIPFCCRAQLRRMHDVLGDMGDVAQECRVKQVLCAVQCRNL